MGWKWVRMRRSSIAATRPRCPSTRASALARSSSPKTSTPSRPASLARYIAVSASVSSASGDSSPVCAIAMPMLADTGISMRSALTAWVTAARMRSATVSASPTPERFSQMARNSSPPSRTSVSEGRMTARTCCATATSSRSPAAWSMVSFTSLKWSRSMKSTATGVLERRDRASAACSRSCTTERFGRPVSESCVACASSAVSTLR